VEKARLDLTRGRASAATGVKDRPKGPIFVLP
jgi:hypothetical protein